MGEFAALLTSFCWATSSLSFTEAGNRVGSIVVNRIRVIISTSLILLTHLAMTGKILPYDAEPQRWFWLGLSGLSGLVIGDAMLLQAYVMVGTRLATLVLTATPVIRTILAWLFLSEIPSALKIVGILITVCGIILVVSEKRNGVMKNLTRKHYVTGLLFALGGATGQSINLILAKRGLYGDFPSISAVLIRMLAATLILWLLAAFRRQIWATFDRVIKDTRSLKFIALGSFFGPFLGIWFSMISIQATLIGVAATLQSLMPIILLPVMKWGFHENVSTRSVLGTFIAIGGVALLFIVP